MTLNSKILVRLWRFPFRNEHTVIQNQCSHSQQQHTSNQSRTQATGINEISLDLDNKQIQLIFVLWSIRIYKLGNSKHLRSTCCFNGIFYTMFVSVCDIIDICLKVCNELNKYSIFIINLINKLCLRNMHSWQHWVCVCAVTGKLHAQTVNMKISDIWNLNRFNVNQALVWAT